MAEYVLGGTTRTVNNEHSSATATDEQTASMPLRRARGVLLLLLLLSISPPLIYYRLIEEALEGTRYPWGLMPAHFLFLRYFGQFSASFPVAIVATIAWSFFRPFHTRRLLAFIAVAFLVFTVAFTSYALVVIALALPNRAA